MKKSSKKRVRTVICSRIAARVTSGSVVSAVAVVSPSTSLTKVSMPTARTNGSAHGSSRRASGPWDAIARKAATAVAVAPTLEARSQVSPSVLAMVVLLLLSGGDDGQRRADRRGFFGIGELAAVAGPHFGPGAGGHLPTTSGQVVDHRFAVARIEQVRQFDVEAMVDPGLADGVGTFTDAGPGVRVVLGGQLTSGG